MTANAFNDNNYQKNHLLIRSHSPLSNAVPQLQSLTKVRRDSAWPEDAAKRPCSARKYPLAFPRQRQCANCPKTFGRVKHSRRFLCDDCRAAHIRTRKRRAARAWFAKMPTDVRRAYYRRQQRVEKARYLHRLLERAA